jgi:hypothetical protein
MRCSCYYGTAEAGGCALCGTEMLNKLLLRLRSLQVSNVATPNVQRTIGIRVCKLISVRFLSKQLSSGLGLNSAAEDAHSTSWRWDVETVTGQFAIRTPWQWFIVLALRGIGRPRL